LMIATTGVAIINSEQPITRSPGLIL
jgi:hypothetical protein